MHRVGQSIELKKDEKIQYKTNQHDRWKEATILGRGGKATGNHRNWFNIRDDEGIQAGINLDKVYDWKKFEEEINVVLIPRDKHEDEKCQSAKRVELKKLKDFDTYEETADVGQFRISTTWVLWNKGDEVRARLVARGYEDEQYYPKDSPTIGKSAMRTVLAITANKNWEIQTTDIKSAFLQGKEMERDVYLTPPKEIRIPGVLWKLKHCLYGLNDAARQFYKSVVECLLKNRMHTEQA